MPSPGSEGRHTWLLMRVLVVALLVGLVIALVPPDHLPYPPGSPFSDAAIAHWPAANFLRDSVLRQGRWPLWNPLRMLGQPFAVNPLNKVWYPPQWLVLALPPTLHLDLLIYAHMTWLGLGLIAWAKAEKLHPLAGAWAALAWGLNPKLMAHLGAGHLDILYALAWAPWLLWAVHRVVVQPTSERAVIAGIVAALLMVADLRIAFYMLPFGALYALTLLASPRGEAGHHANRLAIGLAGLVAVLVSILLSAVQTVPLLAIGGQLTRARIGPQEAAAYSLPPRYLLGLLIPDLGGFHEWMTYSGLPVIALAALAPWQSMRRLQAIALWSMVGVALLWALGDKGPLFLPVIERLPLLSWMRVPSRALFLLNLGLAMLAAWGLDRLLMHGLGRWERLAAAALGFGGVVWTAVTLLLPGLPGRLIGVGVALLVTGTGLWLAGWKVGKRETEARRIGGTRNSSQAGELSGTREPSGTRGLSPLSNLGIARLMGMVLLTATLIISLLTVDVTLVEGRTSTEIDAVDEAIIARLGPEPGLIYSPSFDLIGPAAAQAGIRTLHGVDPFQFQASADLIARAAGVEPVRYSITAPPLPDEVESVAQALREVQPNYDLLAQLGVTWVVAHFPLESDSLVLEAQVGEVYLYRLVRQAPLCQTCLPAYRPTSDVIGAGISGVAAVGLAAWAVLRQWRGAKRG